MPSLKHFIKAARLRTLPLSLSGIIMGTALAYKAGFFDLIIFILALVTTISFQVLSNYANDYGDGVKGTDEHRDGEQRLVASGVISSQQMKNAVVTMLLVSVVLVIALVYYVFKNDFLMALFFLFLGMASVVAAIKYTMGKNAYGYSGLGDLFVFLFFGLVAVLGSYYLFTKQILDLLIVLPAITIGSLSVAVLNLNNMRDQINDKKSGKNTLVVLIGSQKAKMYHYCLLFVAISSFVSYLIIDGALLHISSLPLLLFVIPLLMNAKKVAQTILFKELDAELKKIALTTFVVSILFFILVIY